MSVRSQNASFRLTVCYFAATFLLNPRLISRGSGDPTVGANQRLRPRSASTSFGASPSANPESDLKEEMSEGEHRPRAGTEYGRSARSISSRPDRVALWAVILALVAMVAGAASARAGSGGTGTGDGGGGTGDCVSAQFGKRVLERGDCGNDVETLNWILKAKSYGVPLKRQFENPTDDSVRSFQRKQGFRASGVVNRRTRKAIVGGMQSHMASWYGPGFFGNRTACGQRLRKGTVGLAHRNLPCGTKVVVGYQGRYLRTRVIDRGPFANGAAWDLTQATARSLNFTATDTVRVAKLATQP